MAPRHPPTSGMGTWLVAVIALLLYVIVGKWLTTPPPVHQDTIKFAPEPLQHICTDCSPTFKGLTLGSAFTGGRILTSVGPKIIESDN